LFRYAMLCAALIVQLSPARANDCVALVSSGIEGSFWNAVSAGAMAAARDFDLDIVYSTPENESDSIGQAYLAGQTWKMGCKALVIAPNDPERASLVAQLRAKGIPTVYIDRDTGKADVVAVVSTNNYVAGMLAGDQLAQQLKRSGGKRVVLIRLKNGVQSTDERERGFVFAMHKAGLTVIADPYVGISAEEARVHSAEVLAPLVGKFDGIFTPNETTTDGTLATLRTLGLARHVAFVGFDINSDLYAALKDRTIQALLVQRPFKMGYLGVAIAYREIHGATIPATNVDSGVIVLTRDNMSQPGILFFSDFQAVKHP
jgi:ribose transport system substrate-binding protein